MMSLITKKLPSIASFRGTPSNDTSFDKLEIGFDPRFIKIIVKQGSTAPLELSVDGKDVHMALPVPEAGQNPMVYDIHGLGHSILHVRKTGADVEIYCYGNDY